MCKAASKPAVYGKASVRCPAGYTMERDKMGMILCAKRTLQQCPSGTTLKNGTCCPPDRCGGGGGGRLAVALARGQ
jgi:hypothetical protein